MSESELGGDASVALSKVRRADAVFVLYSILCSRFYAHFFHVGNLYSKSLCSKIQCPRFLVVVEI